MNKNRIRLTESQLHRVIKESVKKVLHEHYALDEPDEYYDELRSEYPSGKQGDVDYSWDLLNKDYGEFSRNDPESAINPYPDYGYHNRERLHTLDRMKNAHSDWIKNDHAYYEDGTLYPSAQFTDDKDLNPKFAQAYDKGDKWRWADAARRDLELNRGGKSFKQYMKDLKDKEQYEKQANSRPLHRKDSLNRELDESKLNSIIHESVNKVLKNIK